MDYSWQEHNRFIQSLLTPAKLRELCIGLTQSKRFLRVEKNSLPNPYEGVSIVSMLDNNANNASLASLLKTQLPIIRKSLDPEQHFYWLPFESFHQTLANMLSDDRFDQHLSDPYIFNKMLPQWVSEAFMDYQDKNQEIPLTLTAKGLGLLGSTLVLLLQMPEKSDYQRLMAFRNQFYRHPDLISLDIKRTRPFAGHISLAYYCGDLDPTSKQQLAEALVQINQSMVDQAIWQFNIYQTELRYYQDLTAFNKKVDFPALHF